MMDCTLLLDCLRIIRDQINQQAQYLVKGSQEKQLIKTLRNEPEALPPGLYWQLEYGIAGVFFQIWKVHRNLFSGNPVGKIFSDSLACFSQRKIKILIHGHGILGQSILFNSFS